MKGKVHIIPIQRNLNVSNTMISLVVLQHPLESLKARIYNLIQTDVQVNLRDSDYLAVFTLHINGFIN